MSAPYLTRGEYGKIDCFAILQTGQGFGMIFRMRYYPMFVSLAGRACLVVGAGQVGLRKIETLAECGASSVLVVDKNPPDKALELLLRRPGLTFAQRDFQETDLEGKFLAIASTSSSQVNQRISDLCRLRGVLCNIVDQPDACTFIVPATVRQGDLTLAVSTGGQSPALAKTIRKDLQNAYGREYALFLALMGRLRTLVLAQGQETEANTALFRKLVGSRLLEAFKNNDIPLAMAELAAHLPTHLHDQVPSLITEILHDSA
ncbi:MAG: bifunctional precorrin-2 dehydrogenase/sirohydrochlorin ferrochelatase [Humidesulfovibrio sp.]|nr:bifunctional precorrin-2 dehydrogenase/sirohydrochlorin ferrochelatase [Humidesulfovibrio sp.]